MANLLEMFGEEYDKVKLTVLVKSRRSNVADMKLRSQVQTLAISYKLSLESFKRELNQWLEETTLGNNANMWSSYQIKEVQSGLEIWHTNSHGDRDRLVCLVNPIGKEVSSEA